MKLTIHTDGGARGNPGPAGIGVVIESEGKLLTEFGKAIGQTTNNVAEYTAVIEALQWLKTNSRGSMAYETIHFILDSTLVVNQLKGLFKIKEPHLQQLANKAHMLEKEVGGIITYEVVRREHNAQADRMVNRALDTQAQETG